jgi:hypothetical protein
MGQRPTHGYESALPRFIDSKRVTRDFRGSVNAVYINNRFPTSASSSHHPVKQARSLVVICYCYYIS